MSAAIPKYMARCSLAHLSVILGEPLKAEDHKVSWSIYFNDPDANPFEITSYGYETIEHELAKNDA